MNRKMLKVLIPLLLFSLCVLTTLAALTSTDVKVNDFYLADLEGEPEESFETPNEWETDSQYPKTVHVINTSNQTVYVRVMLFPHIKKEDLALPAEDLVTMDLSTGDTNSLWMDGEDGYFYYLRSLDPGKTTEMPLLRQVSIGHADSSYEAADLKVEVLSELCSSFHNAHRDAWWQGQIPAIGSVYEAIENALQGGG